MAGAADKSVASAAKSSEEKCVSLREMEGERKNERVGQHRGDTWRASASRTTPPINGERPTCLNVDDFPSHGFCGALLDGRASSEECE